MEIINLKEKEYFIEQYVNLRNSYTELLLTSPVNITDTKEWFKKADIEIRGLIEDNILLGVVILYLSRDGEIAFFAKDKNRGVGSKLLNIIEEVGKEKNLRSVWGWVIEGNFIAQRVFEKSGFEKIESCAREYKGIFKQGFKFKKFLKYL
jgi:ribosomal protein S18 acetylase RimI-like enzyme